MKSRRFLRTQALLLALLLLLSSAAWAAPDTQLLEVRRILSSDYIQPLTLEQLALPTVEALTDSLNDPYTYHMTTDEYTAFETTTNGEDLTVGIGIMVELRADGLYLTKLMPDSPAKAAGLKTGDLIVAVDGITIEELGSPEALVARVSGAVGTPVTVTYLRGGVSHSATVVRAEVHFPDFYGEVSSDRVAWLTATTFGETTGETFGAFVRNQDPNADRWVVDLRDNGGGYSTSAIQIASYLVGNRDVCYAIDRRYNAEPWQADETFNPDGYHITEPAILLLNGMSASSSELVAGAVRDYGAALLIGERTFGKGVGQSIYTLSDGSTLKATTFRYYSPSHITPDRTGILPDLVVPAGMADRVAQLLCGAPSQGADVLIADLAGLRWYLHRAAAEADPEAFTALLSALPADAFLLLDGKDVTAEAAAQAWSAEYTSRRFIDLDGSADQAAIDHMSTLALLSGTGDGIFDPDAPLTRAQLCALLTQGMGSWVFGDDQGTPFADVAEDAWYYSPIKIMHSLGFVQGVNATTFAPDDPVTNEQFYTLLARMGAYSDLDISQRLTAGAMSPEVQAAGFAPWSQPSVTLLQKLGCLTELSEPTAPVTRGQAAAGLYRLMCYMGVIRDLSAPAPAA